MDILQLNHLFKSNIYTYITKYILKFSSEPHCIFQDCFNKEPNPSRKGTY